MSQTTTFDVEFTGYGRAAMTDRSALVAQAGTRLNATATKAVRLLADRDWEGFRRLCRRSGKIRLSMGRHNFDGTATTEVCVTVGYGYAALAAIRIPGGPAWIGMSVTEALALAGLAR